MIFEILNSQFDKEKFKFRKIVKHHVPDRKHLYRCRFFRTKPVTRTEPSSNTDQNPNHIPDHLISDRESVPVHERPFMNNLIKARHGIY